MPPNRSPAAVTAAAASSGLVTSSLTTSRSSALPTALVTVSVLRPVATTAFPAARAALAICAPIPRPVPVINQTLLMIGFLSFAPSSALVLFFADLFHPVAGLAVELFLNGDVRHGRANVSHPARTRSHHPAQFTRSDPQRCT